MLCWLRSAQPIGADRMRLFVALDIDEPILARLDDYVRTLMPRLPGIRFVRSNTYHITLKFLGEVPRAEPIVERLREVHHPGFAIAVRGVGFFPNHRAPRVFWAGIEAPAMAGLAQRIGELLQPLGFAPEGEFHPHLTLARNGSGRPRPVHGERSPRAFAELVRLVTSAPAPEFGTMTAREFFLYESKLSPSGASYEKLARFELAG
jgi:RNA 2',3'-cyclic 3'-phosphodiesterase